MKNSLLLFCVVLLGNACIDRLQFDVDEVEGNLIVDGYISDQPGPYFVKLFLLSKTTSFLNFGHPVTAKKVTLFDSDGASEVLSHQGDGVYASDANGMRGVVGKSYHLRIELSEGTIFESFPDELTPTGTIDSIYSRFESNIPINGPAQNGYRVFINASAATNGGYGRWRYTGTFSLRTFPELNHLYDNCSTSSGPRAPLLCSGFIWTGSILQYVSECTCCISYISQPETIPHLNDNPIATLRTFKNEEVGYVDFDPYVFSRLKYMLKVEYMSLSREAYEYWKVFRDQKKGATSLFQPAFGKMRTNIFAINSNAVAGGFFYATSIHKKVTFINGADAPIPVPQYRTQPPEKNCGLMATGSYLFEHSSTIPPPEWN